MRSIRKKFEQQHLNIYDQLVFNNITYRYGALNDAYDKYALATRSGRLQVANVRDAVLEHIRERVYNNEIG